VAKPADCPKNIQASPLNYKNDISHTGNTLKTNPLPVVVKKGEWLCLVLVSAAGHDVAD
jgi:hypothetical protein